MQKRRCSNYVSGDRIENTSFVKTICIDLAGGFFMLLGIPRGFFYYEYVSFINKLFQDTDVTIISGQENNESTLKIGGRLTVDEACFL